MTTVRPGKWIVHVRTESIYYVTERAKGKVNGEWVDGFIYMPFDLSISYWRSADDFSGFKEMKGQES